MTSLELSEHFIFLLYIRHCPTHPKKYSVFVEKCVVEHLNPKELFCGTILRKNLKL